MATTQTDIKNCPKIIINTLIHKDRINLLFGFQTVLLKPHMFKSQRQVQIDW